jgi:hypothetical protein
LIYCKKIKNPLSMSRHIIGDPLEDEGWEFYHVAQDLSESTNLAAEEPEELAELVKIFDEKAWKYNVYAL